MRFTVRTLLLAASLSLLAATTASADIPLSEAVDIAVKGTWADKKTQTVKLSGHDFYVRPVTLVPTADGVTAKGFFRHRHRGKDDRIHYKIVAKKGQAYEAVITKIEYRGILGNKVLQYGVNVTGAAVGGAKGAAAAEWIRKALEKLKLQRLFDGKWEPQAAKIVDALGARVAQEVK